jgi:hypothetical protein
MLLLYTVVLLLLGAAKFLVARRVAALERRYLKMTRETDKLLRDPALREGNANKADTFKTAKRQFLLGALGQKKDRLEDKLLSWHSFADRFGRLTAAVRNWKGKTIPYTLGVMDVMLVLTLIDYFALGEYLSTRALAEWVRALLAG